MATTLVQSPFLMLRNIAHSLIRQPVQHWRVLVDLFQLVRQHGRLLFEMSRREITDQFAGSYLGVAWSVLTPLTMMAVYAVVFSFIFNMQVDRWDYTVHMIAAYLPWMVIASILVQSTSAVSNRANLVKQTVFPLEILPLRLILPALIPQLVGTVFLIIYQLVRFHALPWTWALWPFLFVCEIMLISGISFAMSAIGVYFRDLRDVTNVIVMTLFYASPILYSTWTLDRVQNKSHAVIMDVMAWNPLSYYIRPFRDACFVGELENTGAWIAFPIVSLIVLVAGYRLFRKLKPQFANAL